MNDDLISRQAAIDTYLETVPSLCVDEGDGMLTACARDRDILEMLENLPSVQPKTGQWIDDCGGVKCSCCGYYIDDNYYAKNYCTNCGAKMEEKTE